jgi:hypothetical protein
VICSLGDKTCGACCWGPSVSRRDLVRRLRRHRSIFDVSDRPTKWRLFRHELRARRGFDLLLAVLLLVPYVQAKARRRFHAGVVCAFLAFRDKTETSVGCLLHPTRWNGEDFRRSAFRLLPGVSCGSPEYLCPAARNFEAATPLERLRFQLAARETDWFDYSLAASTFSLSHHAEKGAPPCRSSSTRRSI